MVTRNKLPAASVLLGSLLWTASAGAYEIQTNTAKMQAMDKITGRVSVIEVPVNGEVKFGSFSIVVRACKKTPPEETPENGETSEQPEKPEGEAPAQEAGEEIVWSDLKEGDMAVIILDEDGNAESVSIMEGDMGQPGDDQSQRSEEYQAETAYTDGTETADTETADTETADTETDNAETDDNEADDAETEGEV